MLSEDQLPVLRHGRAIFVEQSMPVYLPVQTLANSARFKYNNNAQKLFEKGESPNFLRVISGEF